MDSGYVPNELLFWIHLFLSFQQAPLRNTFNSRVFHPLDPSLKGKYSITSYCNLNIFLLYNQGITLLKFWLYTNNFCQKSMTLLRIDSLFKQLGLWCWSQVDNGLHTSLYWQIQVMCGPCSRMLLNPFLSYFNFVWYRQQHVSNSFNFRTNQGFKVWNNMNLIPIFWCFCLNLVNKCSWKIQLNCICILYW